MITFPFRLLVAASAAALAAAPAAAEHWSGPGFGAAANVTVHSAGSRMMVGSAGGSWGGGSHHGGSHHGGMRGHHGDFGYGAPLYYGGWDSYEANASWEPDSYNDWWHERPERAMPRWVQDNARTCERQWWSGGGWRC